MSKYGFNIKSLLHIKKCWDLFNKIITVKASGVVRYQVYEKMLDFVLCGLFCEINFHIILLIHFNFHFKLAYILL